MVKDKRQFKGTSKAKTYYDRPVRQVGYTRVISMGKIIPEDWAYVRMRVLEKSDNAIEVIFVKLLGRDNGSQIEDAREEGE